MENFLDWLQKALTAIQNSVLYGIGSWFILGILIVSLSVLIIILHRQMIFHWIAGATLVISATSIWYWRCPLMDWAIISLMNRGWSNLSITLATWLVITYLVMTIIAIGYKYRPWNFKRMPFKLRLLFLPTFPILLLIHFFSWIGSKFTNQHSCPATAIN